MNQTRSLLHPSPQREGLSVGVPKALQASGPGIFPPSQVSGQTTSFPIFGLWSFLFLKCARASGPLHVLLPLPGAIFPILPPPTLFLLQVAALPPLPFVGSLTRHGPLNTTFWYFFPMELSAIAM